jgi:hypothetical protein
VIEWPLEAAEPAILPARTYNATTCEYVRVFNCATTRTTSRRTFARDNAYNRQSLIIHNNNDSVESNRDLYFCENPIKDYD